MLPGLVAQCAARQKFAHIAHLGGLVEKRAGPELQGHAAIGFARVITEYVDRDVEGASMERAQHVEAVAACQRDVEQYGIGTRIDYPLNCRVCAASSTGASGSVD